MTAYRITLVMDFVIRNVHIARATGTTVIAILRATPVHRDALSGSYKTEFAIKSVMSVAVTLMVAIVTHVPLDVLNTN